MDWKLNDNSLFAILLRSSWWLSVVIGAAVGAIAVAFLPEPYRVFGAITGLPFFVIACIAAWRQLRAPSAATVERTLTAVRAMTWPEFSRALEAGYRGQGFAVRALDGAAANFEITKDFRTTLVGCKRWKVARTGIEPLSDLHALKEERGVHECIYVAAGEVTDNARTFAVKHRIRIVDGPELARLLPSVGRSRNVS